MWGRWLLHLLLQGGVSFHTGVSRDKKDISKNCVFADNKFHERRFLH